MPTFEVMDFEQKIHPSEERLGQANSPDPHNSIIRGWQILMYFKDHQGPLTNNLGKQRELCLPALIILDPVQCSDCLSMIMQTVYQIIEPIPLSNTVKVSIRSEIAVH